MAQSVFAGATNYSRQSILDIKKDIEYWIEMSTQLAKDFTEIIAELRSRGYWNNVPFDFQVFCERTICICETFICDLQKVIEAIDCDRITKREISLMHNIGTVAHEQEECSWKTYKNKDDGYWHDYGNENFQQVEDLYEKGRGYYCTLFDAGNMASRMEDYMRDENHVDNSIHANNSVVVGSNSTIRESEINNGSRRHSNPGKRTVWGKFGIPLLVTIIGGVIVAIIVAKLNL